MFEFLIFGGFWFWSIYGVLSLIIILLAIFSDRFGWIWGLGILLFVIFIINGGINFAWVFANPLVALMWMAFIFYLV